ncbi:MAG: hypothetical protein WD557_09825 [Dehalococcoidia bacterium]
MTQQQSVQRRVFVHPGVLALCWIHADSRSKSANTFLQGLAASGDLFVLLDSTRLFVLQRLATEFETVHLDRSIGSLLAEDVSSTIGALLEQSFVKVIPTNPMLAAGFIVASELSVDLALGMSLFVASSTADELLIVEPPPQRITEAINSRFPMLRLSALRNE